MATANNIRARKPARVPARYKSIPESIRQHLHEPDHTLRDIEGYVIVCHGALQGDHDFTGLYITRILRRHVTSRWSLEADRLAVLLGLKRHENDIADGSSRQRARLPKAAVVAVQASPTEGPGPCPGTEYFSAKTGTLALDARALPIE